MIAVKKCFSFAPLLTFLLVPVVSAQSLTYSTWNLEWLSSQPSRQFASSQRVDSDYQALKRYFEQIDSDVLAFQEVNDELALRKILGDEYQIYLSQRSKKNNQRYQFDQINQYTGFAIRKGIKASNKEDFRLDTLDSSKLRFASYLVIEENSGQPIHALSIHLKAGCSGRINNSQNCQLLKQQGKALNDWIKLREQLNEAYIILGDFNHNMGYQRDWLWESISKQTQASLITRDTRADCKVKSRNNPRKTHQFRSLIDHIIVSKALTASTPKQDIYTVNDVLNYQLSDHCPLSVAIE